jgi:hypothetical protein
MEAALADAEVIRASSCVANASMVLWGITRGGGVAGVVAGGRSLCDPMTCGPKCDPCVTTVVPPAPGAVPVPPAVPLRWAVAGEDRAGVRSGAGSVRAVAGLAKLAAAPG